MIATYLKLNHFEFEQSLKRFFQNIFSLICRHIYRSPT